MLQKSLAKFIKSLQLKKYRKSEQCFIVEGVKSVDEVLNSDFEIRYLLGTADYLKGKDFNSTKTHDIIQVSPKELNAVGHLKNNQFVLGVVKMKSLDQPMLNSKITLVLDELNDPGNLGTIIRIADWYGIKEIVCSENTVDVYNPKVIASTMGSFTRVDVYYKDLDQFLGENNLPIYGADLKGTSIHDFSPEYPCLLLIGSESNGINDVLSKRVSHFLTIPSYGKAESLNAAVATAVICDNLLKP